LASLRNWFFFATLPRRPVSWSRLFTFDVETGVLRVHIYKQNSLKSNTHYI
jgi:hypothetical protein